MNARHISSFAPSINTPALIQKATDYENTSLTYSQIFIVIKYTVKNWEFVLSLNKQPKLKICAIIKLKINAAFETWEGWYQYAVKTWPPMYSGKQEKL